MKKEVAALGEGVEVAPLLNGKGVVIICLFFHQGFAKGADVVRGGGETCFFDAFSGCKNFFSGQGAVERQFHLALWF